MLVSIYYSSLSRLGVPLFQESLMSNDSSPKPQVLNYIFSVFDCQHMLLRPSINLGKLRSLMIIHKLKYGDFLGQFLKSSPGEPKKIVALYPDDPLHPGICRHHTTNIVQITPHSSRNSHEIPIENHPEITINAHSPPLITINDSPLLAFGLSEGLTQIRVEL